MGLIKNYRRNCTHTVVTTKHSAYGQEGRYATEDKSIASVSYEFSLKVLPNHNTRTRTRTQRTRRRRREEKLFPTAPQYLCRLNPRAIPRSPTLLSVYTLTMKICVKTR